MDWDIGLAFRHKPDDWLIVGRVFFLSAFSYESGDYKAPDGSFEKGQITSELQSRGFTGNDSIEFAQRVASPNGHNTGE